MLGPNEFTSTWMDASELAGKLELGDLIEIRRVVGVAKRRIYAVSHSLLPTSTGGALHLLRPTKVCFKLFSGLHHFVMSV